MGVAFRTCQASLNSSPNPVWCDYSRPMPACCHSPVSVSVLQAGLDCVAETTNWGYSEWGQCESDTWCQELISAWQPSMCYFISCKQVVHLRWDYAQAQSKAHALYDYCAIFKCPHILKLALHSLASCVRLSWPPPSASSEMLPLLVWFSPRKYASHGNDVTPWVTHPCWLWSIHTLPRDSVCCAGGGETVRRKLSSFFPIFSFSFSICYLFVLTKPLKWCRYTLVEGLQHWHKA